MLKFASDAIMSFSYKPLKLATYLGFLVSVVSFIYLLVMVILKLCGTMTTVPGWTSIIVITLFFNGIILLVLGIIGEYIGRIYDEAKGRPLYVVQDMVNFPEDTGSER